MMSARFAIVLAAFLGAMGSATAGADGPRPAPGFALYELYAITSPGAPLIDGEGEGGTPELVATATARPIAPVTCTVQRDGDWLHFRFRYPLHASAADLRLAVQHESAGAVAASGRRGASSLFLHYDAEALALHRLDSTTGATTILHGRRVHPAQP